MNDFMINLLNLVFFPFGHMDNLLIYIPTLSLSVCFVCGLVYRMVYGGDSR